MSKQTNPAVIGGFVVGAVVLLTIGIAVFGGSELLQRKTIVVAYFDGSVKGLRVGSNVLFSGVRVGYVSDIDVLTDITTLESQVQVTMELSSEEGTYTRDGMAIMGASAGLVSLEQLIDAGLRAQLNSESFVTGQLVVELDLRPDTEAVFRGVNPPYPEVPSMQSDIQEVIDSLQSWFAQIQENIDVGELARTIESTVQGADRLVNSPDVTESLAGINRLVNSQETQALAGSLQTAIAELRETLADGRALIAGADEQLTPLLRDLRPAANSLDQTLATAEETLAAARLQLEGDTQLVYELTTTLKEVRKAARNLSELADYVERNPESLLRGKRP